MKRITLFLLFVLGSTVLFAQVDSQQLALDVSQANAENAKKLAAFIWKRHSTATVNGEVKATLINELSFGEDGKLKVTQVGGESNVKKKRGVRGKMQQNAMESNAEYIENALKLTAAYTFMSKGQMLDFFEKAIIIPEDSHYKVSGKDVLVAGDQLTVFIDKETLLFTQKLFWSKLGEDKISGEINYGTFESGISHGTTTAISLPAKNMLINAENKDYSKRIQ